MEEVYIPLRGSARKKPRLKVALGYSNVQVSSHANSVEEYKEKVLHILGACMKPLFIGGEEEHFWNDKDPNGSDEKR